MNTVTVGSAWSAWSAVPLEREASKLDERRSLVGIVVDAIDKVLERHAARPVPTSEAPIAQVPPVLAPPSTARTDSWPMTALPWRRGNRLAFLAACGLALGGAGLLLPVAFSEYGTCFLGCSSHTHLVSVGGGLSWFLFLPAVLVAWVPKRGWRWTVATLGALAQLLLWWLADGSGNGGFLFDYETRIRHETGYWLLTASCFVTGAALAFALLMGLTHSVRARQTSRVQSPPS